MPSKSRLFSQLIAGSGQIKADRLSDDISTIEQVASTENLTAVGNTVGDQRVINNNLYIWNGSGWYRIALINASPTWDSGGQPAGAYVLDADSPQDATVITLAASDPDGLPISYNYITSGQMDSIATISQDSSVFTITPKTSTQVPDGGTGSITFRATDGINILPQVSSFTLTFITTIENSRYTTLLVSAVGTSDNNNITDSSTNNHSITVNGGTPAGTFSPYRHGGYSLDIGSGSSYVYTSNHSDFAFGTGYFSVEAWINFSSFTNSGFTNTQDSTSTASSGQWYVSFVSSTVIRMGGHGAPNYTDATVAEMTVGDWHHVILKRDGNGFKVFVDGTEATSYSSSGTAVASQNFSSSSGTFTVGYTAGSGPALGKIADFRVLKGGAASTSTPTERLTEITNTVLLTAHTNRIFDETGTHTLTPTGTVSVAPSGPHDYTEYSATDHGGSVYFDGTTDYIEHQGGFTLPTGTNANWTIECWVNLDQVNLNQGILRVSSTEANGNNDDIYFSEQSGYINTACKGGAIASTTANYKMNANTWHHIAMVKNSGTVYLYNNGVYCGSVSDSNDYSGNYYVYGGLYYSSSYCFAGYLSDFKISNSAIYTTGTSNFTPPTAPLSSSGASLHIKGTDASIIDKSQSRNIFNISNITSTTQTKFANTRSIYFDGSTSVNLNETLIFPTTNTPFTGELWFYPTNVAGAGRLIGQADSPNSGRLTLNLETDGRIRLYWNGANDLYSTNSISDNQWHHIAFVRKNNGYLAVYVNGTETELAQDNNNRSVDSSLTRIGSSGPSYFPSYIQGYIQDVRLTNGLARYTTNFTPPTAPLEG